MKRISRSAMVTRVGCEMRRYRTYEFRGKGVTPRDFAEPSPGVVSLGALPKVRGAIFHNISLAIVEGAEQKDWVEILAKQVQVLPESIRHVQTTLIRRAMIGWELIRGPYWRNEFDVVSAEAEWAWALTPNILQPLRLDKILRHKATGSLGIFDYKTMSSVDPNWVMRMTISSQTHTYIQALKERSDEWLMGMCYDGVIIGKLVKGVQRSPFVTGHEKYGKVSPKWSAGSTHFDVTQFSDEKWLEWIHHKANMLRELYVTTGFINPTPNVLLHRKASLGMAEEEYTQRIDHVEAIRETYGEESHEYESALGLIEKNDDACLKYGFDYACPFVKQCWQGFPMDAEEFEPRKDHHEGDAEDAEEG